MKRNKIYAWLMNVKNIQPYILDTWNKGVKIIKTKCNPIFSHSN